MKRGLWAVAALFVAGVANAEPPAPTAAVGKPATTAVRPPPPVVGGYVSGATETAEVAKARAAALQALKIKQGENRDFKEAAAPDVQVVAGLNYRFHFAASDGARYDVVVYRDLSGAMSVTSIDAGK